MIIIILLFLFNLLQIFTYYVLYGHFVFRLSSDFYSVALPFLQYTDTDMDLLLHFILLLNAKVTGTRITNFVIFVVYNIILYCTK